MAGNQMRKWLARAVAPFRHFRDDADLKAELQVHLELQAEDAAGPGVSTGEARRRARLKLGNTQAVVENVRDQEFLTMFESCYRDIALGVRGLRKSPVFCITAILTLASEQDTLVKGVLLLAVYSLGLAVPFLLTSLLMERFLKFYSRFRSHMHALEVASGGLLIALGILLVIGRFTLISSWLSFLNRFAL